jgi:mRNA interferase MazF
VKPSPARGEVWTVDLDPVRGHEQAGRRPAIVVSSDRFNRGPAALIVVVPMTSVEKRIPLHVEVPANEGGLKGRGFVKPEDIRSISTDRLGTRLGMVSPATLNVVEARLRHLLEL